MTFKEYVDALGKELGVEIETEGDACAVTLGTEAATYTAGCDSTINR